MPRSFHISAKQRKFILLVWASAIVWIYLGNIINFHQHHIWGKQLIPVAVTNNRSKEKSCLKYHSSDAGIHQPVKEVAQADLMNAADDSQEPCFAVSLIVIGDGYFHPLTASLKGLSLRAPPAC